MNEKERATKDINKLKKILVEFKRYGLEKKYPQILEWAENYLHDSEFFFEKKDYFSAFGSANYAFGIVDAILIIENKKDETNVV